MHYIRSAIISTNHINGVYSHRVVSAAALVKDDTISGRKFATLEKGTERERTELLGRQRKVPLATMAQG
jgi:hypothetical protein